MFFWMPHQGTPAAQLRVPLGEFGVHSEAVRNTVLIYKLRERLRPRRCAQNGRGGGVWNPDQLPWGRLL